MDRNFGVEINTNSRDWAIQQAWRMRHYKGASATVPGGHEIAIDEREYLDIQPPGADYDGVVDRIAEFLKHPKPGCAYLWRARLDESTTRLKELHFIRPVLHSELKEAAATVHLYGYNESGIPDAEGHRTVQTYVGWRKAGLYEVRPDKAKEWFIDPGKYHLRLIMKIPEEIAGRFEDEGIGTATMERKDPRSQAQEAALDQRKGR
jgi:hypothetical protein